MDVTRSNFVSLLPQIEADIESSIFVAIDTEFSGLGQNRHYNLFDTLEARYQKIKDTCFSYCILQVGICCFYLEEDEYKCKSYNFYIFPYKVPNVPHYSDKAYSFQPSAFHFLASHGFDFNKWVKEGISYMHVQEEEALMEKIRERECESKSSQQGQNSQSSSQRNALYVPDDHKEFVNSFVTTFKEFVKDEAKDKLDLEPCSSYRRKLIYESVRNMQIPGIKLSTCITSEHSSDRHISIAKISKDEKEKALKEMIIEAVGFSKVVQHLIKSKKPLIGHNLLLDVIHIVRHFITSLPNNLSEFKIMILELFPFIFDTKLIAMDKRFKEIINQTALNDLYRLTQKEPFRSITAELSNKPPGEENDASYHQAAYDAYITGLCFINMYHYLCPKEKFITFNNPVLAEYQGKFNLTYIYDASYLEITRQQSLSSRDNVFHLSFPSEWTSKEIHELFSPFGSIQIGWIDDTSAFVAVKDETRVKDVEKSIQKTVDSKFTLVSYHNYQKLKDSTNNTEKRRLECDELPIKNVSGFRSELEAPQPSKKIKADSQKFERTLFKEEQNW